jgi:hypothetical protein
MGRHKFESRRIKGQSPSYSNQLLDDLSIEVECGMYSTEGILCTVIYFSDKEIRSDEKTILSR